MSVGPGGGSSPDDLLVAAGRGDAHAFGLFYDRVAGTITGFVRTMLGDPVSADEVTHEILVEVWRTAGRYSPAQGEAVAWVMALARLRVVDRLSSASGVAPPVDVRPDRAFADAPPGCGNRGRVLEGMARLPRSQREVLLRVHDQGQTFHDIGRALRISASAARVLARGGMTRLLDILASSEETGRGDVRTPSS